MSEATLYLFDGYNLLHASDRSDPEELSTCSRASSPRAGVRGVVVFDGNGVEREVGSLSVRWAAHADDLLERLAAEHRGSEQVLVVSSDERCGASRARRCGSSPRGGSWPSSSRRATARSSSGEPGRVSATGSTRRRASASSASAAA